MACCCSSVCDATERQFGEKRASKDLEQYRKKGPGPTARMLRDGLGEAGAVNGDALDVGAGVGAIAFELLERGARSAVGVDMSPSYVAAASSEAVRRSRSDAVRFIQGDFVAAAAHLPAADVVTLDRVVCCYPDETALLDESLAHARRCIALSYPRDRWYVKMVIGFENLVRQVRGNPFRTFVHSPAAMQQRIEGAGFRFASRRSTLAWRADVFINSRKANV